MEHHFRCAVVLVLTVLVTMPHYLVLSSHRSFFSYKYGTFLSLPFVHSLSLPVIFTLFGLLLSVILIRCVFGTFVVLCISTLTFTFCCVDLMFATINDSLPDSYQFTMMVACMAIGMAQPNLAAFFGDQFVPCNVKHYLMYAVLNMFEIYVAFCTGYMKESTNLKCGTTDCHSLTYIICSAFSTVAFVILLFLYIFRSRVVILLLVHRPLKLYDSQVVQSFWPIMSPLFVITILFLVLEQELFRTAFLFNRNLDVKGVSHIELFQLIIFYFLLSLFCIPAVIMLYVGHVSAVKQVGFGCCLISLASIYLGILHSLFRDDLIDMKPTNSSLVGIQIYNGMCDASYNLSTYRMNGSLPFLERLGPFYTLPNETKITLSSNQTNPSVFNCMYGSETLDLENTLLNITHNASLAGKLVSIIWHSKEPATFIEQLHRASSGLPLLRIIFPNDDGSAVVCVQSVLISKCITNTSWVIIEVNSDWYAFTMNGNEVCKYYLHYDAYYTIYIFQMGSVTRLSTFEIIPPFAYSIYWHLLPYTLLSVAQGVILAAGLDAAYHAGPHNQKSLCITILYGVYVSGWIGYRVIDENIGFNVNESLEVTTAVALLATAWFYAVCCFRSPFLKREVTVEAQ